MEEANGNAARCDAVINKALKALKANAVELTREEWIAEAEKSEKAAAPATAQAIIKGTAVNILLRQIGSYFCHKSIWSKISFIEKMIRREKRSFTIFIF